MSNLVIVAIPDENDRVWKVSSEQVPHLTVLFLGDVDAVANLETIVEFVQHAASTTLGRFYLPVDRRGELGDDSELGPADVLFFKKGRYDYKAIRDFRASLLQENNIRTAYDSAQQFDGPWMPHLTLGYEKQPAKPQTGDQDYPFYDVSFNKIAVWTGDYDGPEFDLTDPWDEFDALETVPMDVAMSDISHHGVKGMHWGQRKEDIGKAATTSLTKVGKAVADVHKFAGDVKFESHTRPQVDPTTGEESHSKAREKVVEAAHKDFKSKDLAAINAKPEYVKARKLRNRLLKPLDKTTRAYRAEVKAAYIKRLETTANSMKNPSGTREYSIRERGGDLPTSKYQWEVSTREARHAAEDDFTLVDVITDTDGFITGTKVAESEKTMAQTVELGMDFLEHYGVKGMHWGVRREGAVTTQTHLDTGLRRRQTKVVAKGGESHDAHPDAVKAAVAKQKIKKSGSAALSTQELRDLANRLQVENQVGILMSSKGKQFVNQQLEQETKNVLKEGARTGIGKAAPHVIRKARRGAATVATTAALAL